MFWKRFQKGKTTFMTVMMKKIDFWFTLWHQHLFSFFFIINSKTFMIMEKVINKFNSIDFLIWKNRKSLKLRFIINEPLYSTFLQNSIIEIFRTHLKQITNFLNYGHLKTSPICFPTNDFIIRKTNYEGVSSY